MVEARIFQQEHEYDVVVLGSGAAGMIAAIRAADWGLSAVVIEKARQYGGTSALSGGGMWIPGHHHGLEKQDSPEMALAFLKSATDGQVSETRLKAYIENAPLTAKYIESLGIALEVEPAPDYLHEIEGTVPGRCLVPSDVNGSFLGKELENQREPAFFFLLFNRYAIGLKQAMALVTQPFGWQWTILKICLKYWSDLPWRLRSKRDRTLTMGSALVAQLRKAMIDRNIPLLLDHRLVRLERENDGDVRSAVVRHNGRDLTFRARRAIVLATGGFEHNQSMRDQYLPVETSVSATTTPPGANTGDGIRAGQEVGAGVEFMQHGWWFPTAQFPSQTEQNLEIPFLMAEYRHPFSIMVNRNGARFTNEFSSYDRIGLAMIDDALKHRANAPCWMIFDASFRKSSRCGPIMPQMVMPDRRIPEHWWGKYIHRAGTIGDLAEKIRVDRQVLEETVSRYNACCEIGVDQEFGRGSSDYDRYYGHPKVKPNICLGRLDHAPFYAVRIELGDLGTKGGLAIDEHWRVLDGEGKPIPGLYATGNTTGSIMAGCYPGAGGTLGPAIIGAYIAANEIHQMALGASPVATSGN